MPHVDVLLVGQAAGRRSIAIAAGLSVAYGTGAGSTEQFVNGMSLSMDGGTLSVPLLPCIFRLDNSDGNTDLIVKCPIEAGVTIAATYTALLFCDGTKVLRLGADDPIHQVIAAIGAAAGIAAADAASA